MEGPRSGGTAFMITVSPTPGWNYPFKVLLAWFAIKRWKSSLTSLPLSELPYVGQNHGCDGISLKASAPDSSTVIVGIRKICSKKNVAEVTVFIKLSDGTTFKLPQHPETAVSEWVNTAGCWNAGGLKIQELEPQKSLRILFNGVLIRAQDNKSYHVKMNLLWASATSVQRYPEDWNDCLAAKYLALEPWTNEQWPFMLNRCVQGSGSWLQFGAIQGRFQSFDVNGDIHTNEYLRVRGARERIWSLGSRDRRRSVTINVCTRDGTAVQIRGLSYHNNFTQCLYGSVRLPNFLMTSVKSCDLVLSEFCETADEIPKTFTINVTTSNGRTLKLVLRIKDGGTLYTGVPHEQSIIYRTLEVDINGEHGTGILELGYECLDGSTPSNIKPSPTLRWLSEDEAGSVGNCVSLDSSSAACIQLTGGKAASLALLSSVQEEQGYKVPPGFCITTKALCKHLEIHTSIKDAISEIEACNKDYDENIFKEKCSRAVELFLRTEIVEDVRNDILSYLRDLRNKYESEELFTPLRFAVRSSGVGEDSEALSAAGQNETVLGCVTDDDVLRGVKKCWASMFAYTSVYYRRQNGQLCFSLGGVVVQALVKSRAAGVLFTSHPPHGDVTRILLTANYGLGESVVSGSVEPDSIVIRRDLDDTLSIQKIDLGSKIQRVVTNNDGVSFENVPESDRNKSCLSENEIFKLAKIAVAQERLWGAGRDIEWAIFGDDIFLLQARPITSLERWTEEELLHEFDDPIMADDELITFANTGEVFPKPLTPLSYDLVVTSIFGAISKLMRTNGDGWDKSVLLTHNRCSISLYNSVYRRAPKEINVNMRMLEMSIHGHKVADDAIHATALHRRSPSVFDTIVPILDALKPLLTSKWVMKETTRLVSSFNPNVETNDPLKFLEVIAGTKNDILKFNIGHCTTTVASTFSQFIAMTVMLEGRSDFTSEECNEVSTLLSSGDAVSAEVPHVLDRLALSIEESGKIEEFRKQKPEQSLIWLKQNLPKIYDDVLSFLDQHGHRAIMEFDLATKPWSLVPEDLMRVLMNMRPTSKTQTSKRIDELIASLKTPKKANTKKILRWLMPFCRRTVSHREGTKAQLILAVHKLRLAVRRLATMMYHSWMIPDVELVFYFRLHELKEYIITRDPGLAVQRQQYYTKWCQLKFSEMNKGWPEPLKVEGPRVTSGDVKIFATSVCQGEIIARACVVKDLSEINQLRQGDVLITHSTDIGWSPYFPLLSGIVTELGGLISHGAVIAREYGLPCVVGATHATDIFNTGDTVRLSGDQGFLERVKVDAST
ncbi:unnamed protein product [Danaus chrysippus]|uniref:(African queen) hypothetical protein n=1 Tax=Danaus chrysippus TaxID=151541 RepID=A0A8J2RGB3_9NEOP|nr:unnamed protein product [Danaus chrysippus]